MFEICFLQDSHDEWIFDPDIDAILNSYKRNREEAFSDDDDDDSIHDPSLDPIIMTGGGGGAPTSPLLDFQLRAIGARRNWKNAVNKQRFDATLQQHREAIENDDLGTEVTQSPQRVIQQQIQADNTLKDHSTVHLIVQSNTFTHAFQSTTFTVREFREGSERLETYLQALATKLNSNEEFTPDDTFTAETTFHTRAWKRTR